uniref:No apical meristem-associated C-terminal domain-containing protein n=1 Tax=Oryza punctata TaxID=4537 RepID=A0A0E0LF33_ORYPU
MALRFLSDHFPVLLIMEGEGFFTNLMNEGYNSFYWDSLSGQAVDDETEETKRPMGKKRAKEQLRRSGGDTCTNAFDHLWEKKKAGAERKKERDERLQKSYELDKERLELDKKRSRMTRIRYN